MCTQSLNTTKFSFDLSPTFSSRRPGGRMETPSKPAVEGIRYPLRALNQLRPSVQKFEFASLWIIIIHTVIFQQISAISVLYKKLSFVLRLAAYSIDFANANAKYNQKPNTITLPLWLVFHHSGVAGMHLFSAFFFCSKGTY